MTRRVGRLGRRSKARGGGEQRVADRGQPVRAALARPDARRRRRRRSPRRATRVQPTVTDLLVAIRPFEHQRLRSRLGAAAIASTSRGFSKARAMPSCCSIVFVGVDALRHVDRQHQREIDRLPAPPRPAGQREADESSATARRTSAIAAPGGRPARDSAIGASAAFAARRPRQQMASTKTERRGARLPIEAGDRTAPSAGAPVVEVERGETRRRRSGQTKRMSRLTLPGVVRTLQLDSMRAAARSRIGAPQLALDSPVDARGRRMIGARGQGRVEIVRSRPRCRRCTMRPVEIAQQHVIARWIERDALAQLRRRQALDAARSIGARGTISSCSP